MADDDSLTALQGIHRDLCALIDLKLPVLDRLASNLETRLGELSALLDKKPKNDSSRKTLASGINKPRLL
jgi:nuclear pore complex protein Nup205